MANNLFDNLAKLVTKLATDTAESATNAVHDAAKNLGDIEGANPPSDKKQKRTSRAERWERRKSGQSNSSTDHGHGSRNNTLEAVLRSASSDQGSTSSNDTRTTGGSYSVGNDKDSKSEKNTKSPEKKSFISKVKNVMARICGGSKDNLDQDDDKATKYSNRPSDNTKKPEGRSNSGNKNDQNKKSSDNQSIFKEIKNRLPKLPKSITFTGYKKREGEQWEEQGSFTINRGTLDGAAQGAMNCIRDARNKARDASQEAMESAKGVAEDVASAATGFHKGYGPIGATKGLAKYLANANSNGPSVQGYVEEVIKTASDFSSRGPSEIKNNLRNVAGYAGSAGTSAREWAGTSARDCAQKIKGAASVASSGGRRSSEVRAAAKNAAEYAGSAAKGASAAAAGAFSSAVQGARSMRSMAQYSLGAKLGR